MSLSLFSILMTAPAVVAAPAEPAMPQPAAILADTRRVADWQLANRTNWATMPAARKACARCATGSRRPSGSR